MNEAAKNIGFAKLMGIPFKNSLYSHIVLRNKGLLHKLLSVEYAETIQHNENSPLLSWELYVHTMLYRVQQLDILKH